MACSQLGRDGDVLHARLHGLRSIPLTVASKAAAVHQEVGRKVSLAEAQAIQGITTALGEDGS